MLFFASVLLSACTSVTGWAGAAADDLGDPDILYVAMTSHEGEIVTSQAVVDDTQNTIHHAMMM